MKRLFNRWEKHRKSKYARRLARTVFVRVLKENVTEDHLRTASEQCNLAVAQTLVEKNSLGRIGYVEFAEAGDVTKACTGKLLKKQLRGLRGAQGVERTAARVSSRSKRQSAFLGFEPLVDTSLA